MNLLHRIAGYFAGLSALAPSMRDSGWQVSTIFFSVFVYIPALSNAFLAAVYVRLRGVRSGA